MGLGKALRNADRESVCGFQPEDEVSRAGHRPMGHGGGRILGGVRLSVAVEAS
jgi:hypothetical protein